MSEDGKLGDTTMLQSRRGDTTVLQSWARRYDRASILGEAKTIESFLVGISKETERIPETMASSKIIIIMRADERAERKAEAPTRDATNKETEHCKYDIG